MGFIFGARTPFRLSPFFFIQLLKHCERPLIVTNGVMPTKLYSLNCDVDSENLRHFQALPGDVYKFAAIDGCSPNAQNLLSKLQRDCQAHTEIQLKVGTQVILLKNLDTAKGLCNGSRGVVVQLVPIEMVELDDEVQHYANRNTHIPIVNFANGAQACIQPCGM